MMQDPRETANNGRFQEQVTNGMRIELKQLLQLLRNPVELDPKPVQAADGDNQQRELLDSMDELRRSQVPRDPADTSNSARPLHQVPEQRQWPDVRTEAKELALSLFRIAADGARVILLLLFEALALFVLKYGPFADYRPVIEPALLRTAWGIVCLFGLVSIMLFIVQFLNHLKQQKLGIGRLVAAFVTLVAFGWGSQYFVPPAANAHYGAPLRDLPPEAILRPNNTSAASPKIALLTLPSPTRGAAASVPATPSNVVWEDGHVGVLIGVFVAYQKNVVYQWELDNDGHRENLTIPDDGHAWLYVRRSRLADRMHTMVIHRVAQGRRAPDSYEFLTTDAH